VPVEERCAICWDYDFEHDTIIWADGPAGRVAIVHGVFGGGDNHFTWRGTDKWGFPLDPGWYEITVEPQDEWSGFALSDAVCLLPPPRPWESFPTKISTPPFDKTNLWLANGWVEYKTTVSGGVRAPAVLAVDGTVYWLEVKTPSGSGFKITPEGDLSASAPVSKTTETGVGLGPVARSVNYWIGNRTELTQLQAINWGVDYHFTADQKITRVLEVKQWVADTLVVVAILAFGEFAPYLLPFVPALRRAGAAGSPGVSSVDTPILSTTRPGSLGLGDADGIIEQVLGSGTSAYCSCLPIEVTGWVYAGEDLTFSGEGFTPSGNVILVLGLPGESDPRAWHSVRCDENGAFTATVSLGLDWPGGEYAILAFDESQIEQAATACVESGDLSELTLRLGLGTCTVVRDTVPPESKAIVRPPDPDGLNDWWISEVAVTLTAQDVGLGVTKTHWRMDGGPWSAYGDELHVSEGVHELEFYSEDLADNSEIIKHLESRVDTTAPHVAYEGTTGWTNKPADAVVTAWDATSQVDMVELEDGDGVLHAGHGERLEVQFPEEGHYQFAYWATDRAGNSTLKESVWLGVDYSSPTVLAFPAREPNSFGWYKDPVAVSFEAQDPPLRDGSSGSGVRRVSLARTIEEEGADLLIAGQAEDNADNVGEGATRVSLDMTPPDFGLEITGGPVFADTEYLEFTVSAEDSLSGLLSVELTLDGTPVDRSPACLWSLPLGEHELMARAVDRAGNEAFAYATFVTDTSLASLIELKHVFLDMGWISVGMGKGLDAKLDAAARAAERGNTNAWEAGIEAFLNELSAQTGKHVSSEASQILMRDAEHLLAEGPGF
jgi:hypothetical protein